MSGSRPPAPSGAPLLGQTVAFVRDPLGMYGDVAAECGDVARLWVLGLGEFYALTHPDHVERVLTTDRDAFAKTRDFRVALGESVVSTEGERWRRQREALEEFFYPARVRSYADRMVDLTERRLDRWTPGERLSLHEEMSGAALDNLFGTVFDRPLDPDGDERLRRAANGVNLWFRPSSFALPEWVPTPSRRRFRASRATLEREARRLLREAREGGGDDLLSTLAALQEREETDLTDDEIVDQVVGLTFAGHDTTALVLTYALHHLGTHEAARERFHAELDAVLDGRPTLDDAGDLEVTRRILHETMRLYPPVHTVPRETTRPVEFDGYRLEPGTRTHLAVWQVHRDARFWDDPESWRPSRWRDASPASKGGAFVPFGAGPRTCLGRRFALLEGTLVLASVGRRFVLDPAGPLSFDPMVTTQPADGVPVRVRSR
ncbi:MAG: cytochrome P450 [Haloferacaceae archaeon]